MNRITRRKTPRSPPHNEWENPACSRRTLWVFTEPRGIYVAMTFNNGNNSQGRPNPSDDETRSIDRVTGDDPETTSFGAQRPRQVFPSEAESTGGNAGQAGAAAGGYQYTQYQQPGQPSQPQPSYPQNQGQGSFTAYEEPPRSYDPPREKKGSGAAGILGALLVLALIAAGALAFMYAKASNRPDPAPVTSTVTTTAVETTTAKVTETKTETVTESPETGRRLPTELPTAFPTELPNDLEDQLGGDAQSVEEWLDELFGGAGAGEGGNGNSNSNGNGHSNA